VASDELAAINYCFGGNNAALASLESLNQQLREAGITFHLTEIKGPVMDKLQQTHFYAI